MYHDVSVHTIVRLSFSCIDFRPPEAVALAVTVAESCTAWLKERMYTRTQHHITEMRRWTDVLQHAMRRISTRDAKFGVEVEHAASGQPSAHSSYVITIDRLHHHKLSRFRMRHDPQRHKPRILRA